MWKILVVIWPLDVTLQELGLCLCITPVFNSNISKKKKKQPKGKGRNLRCVNPGGSIAASCWPKIQARLWPLQRQQRGF